MTAYLALQTLHVGKPGESGSIIGGTVFDPSEAGIDPAEIRRLMWRGFVSETDQKPADNPVVPHEAGPPPEDGQQPFRLPAASGPESGGAMTKPSGSRQAGPSVRQTDTR